MYTTTRYYNLGVYEMKRTKAFIAVILTIVALAFIVFVGIMQQKFTNPDFASMPTPQTDTESVTSDEESESDVETDAVAGAVGSVVTEDESDEDSTEDAEDVEVSTSTRTVQVETLNARSGPGIDYDLVGVLVMDQQVEVEDRGDEWVKVTTDEFTGYVNAKYLSEE